MLDRHFNTAERKSFFIATRLYEGIDARLDLSRILPPGPILLVVDAFFANSDAAGALGASAMITVGEEPKRQNILDAWQALASRPFKSVIALGGGSSIDTAKALHCLASFGQLDIRDMTRPPGAPALIAIPTTAGSGSETSRFFILADENGVKRSYRAWSFAPDIALLDPSMLAEAGRARLLLGAFDTLVHLWETYICRNEHCFEAEMLALEGIPLIASALHRLADDVYPDVAARAGLQRASAYGGYAIANVRTGLMHTLAESLAAQLPLAHPETLFVFFEAALAQYGHAVADKIARLDRRLAAELGPQHSFAALRAVIATLFERTGITARIERTLAALPADLNKLGETVARDTVLAKEHPVPLMPEEILGVATRALNRRAPPTSSVA